MTLSKLLIFFYCFGITLTAFSLNPPELMAGKKRYDRSEIQYSLPDVTLINQNRENLKLQEILKADKVIMLNFIWADCTTICPVMSAGFSHLQKKLGPDAENIWFISISIDPEYDTPEVMNDYLNKYRALPGWDFFTGTRKDIDSVMRAFDAYVANKMNHYPLTFLWAPGHEKWVRINGMVGTSDLISEYELLLDKKPKP
ncbi:MAG: SCO family protein [Desulfobulbaceae bacterium]|nr:SCO family protein [Desulfobulbaceae bacterium]